MVETARAFLLDEADDRLGEITRPRRLADLVGDDVERLALAGQRQHCRDEVRPVGPVEPGGPHDERVGVRGAHGPLPCSLRAAVGRARVLRMIDVVRSRAPAVEDVVGRDVHELCRSRSRGARDVEGTRRVEGEGRRLLRLGGIDRGVRGTVHDDVRPLLGDDALDLGPIGDVAPRRSEGDDRHTTPLQQRHQILTEHACAAEDQPGAPHLRLPARRRAWARSADRRTSPPSRP